MRPWTEAPRTAALVLLGALAAAPAAAESEGFLARALAVQGDPAYGEYLAQECLTCHQASGADKGIPSITGWPPEVFISVLVAYKFGERQHQVMQMVAGSLGEEEIAALAVYIGGLGAR